MNAENDRLPYEKPTLLCLTLDLGIVKGGDSEYGVEQPTPEDETNPDPFA